MLFGVFYDYKRKKKECTGGEKRMAAENDIQ